MPEGNRPPRTPPLGPAATPPAAPESPGPAQPVPAPPVTETSRIALEQAAETARQTDEAAGRVRQMAEQGLATAGRIARESAEDGAAAARAATRDTGADLSALLAASSAMLQGWQELQRAWIDTMERTLRASAQAPQSLLRAGSLPELMRVHESLLRETLETMMAGSRRMLEITGRTARDAARPIEQRGAGGPPPG